MKKPLIVAVVLLLFLLALFPVVDLTAAALYFATGAEKVASIRYVRDVITITLAVMTVCYAPPSRKIFLPAAAYAMFILIYSGVGITRGMSAGLVLSSAALLFLPILGVFAGIYSGRLVSIVPKALLVLAVMMGISVLFGLYEINDTEFWSQTVGYGPYLREVKGIPNGFNMDADLPWNFFGNDGARRAAGLLAAPLAQGSFVMSVGLCCFAWLLPQSMSLAIAVLSFSAVGVYMSGTRGAMLVMLVSLSAYIAMMGAQWKRYIPGFFIATILFLVFAKDRVLEIITYSIQMTDGSTEGHLYALLLNLSEFHRVVIFGDGVGMAGAIASYIGSTFSGGGEGALFSIGFQLGLPGMLIFLWYYSALYRELRGADRLLILNGSAYASVARMLAAQAIGYATTFISSEHILTFSGMAAYWLLSGVILGAVQSKEEQLTLLSKLFFARSLIEKLRARDSTT